MTRPALIALVLWLLALILWSEGRGILLLVPLIFIALGLGASGLSLLYAWWSRIID